jgi:transcriptional regulator with XRE-family HTH domain
MAALQPLSDVIKQRRLDKGMNQTQLARAARVALSSIKNIERGIPTKAWSGAASEPILARIAAVLNCNISDISRPMPRANGHAA